MGCGASKKQPNQVSEPLENIVLEKVGIPSFDSFFESAAAPLNTTVDFRNALQTGTESFLTLIDPNNKKLLKQALTEFGQNLKEFRTNQSNVEIMLEITEDGVEIKYQNIAQELIPAHIWKLTNALIDLVESIKTIIKAGPDLVKQIQELVEQSKEFASKAKDEASSAGLDFMKTAKAIKATASNSKKLASAPTILQSTIEQAKTSFTDIREGLTELKNSL